MKCFNGMDADWTTFSLADTIGFKKIWIRALRKMMPSSEP